jgi:hypothetical protein
MRARLFAGLAWSLLVAAGVALWLLWNLDNNQYQWMVAPSAPPGVLPEDPDRGMRLGLPAAVVVLCALLAAAASGGLAAGLHRRTLWLVAGVMCVAALLRFLV